MHEAELAQYRPAEIDVQENAGGAFRCPRCLGTLQKAREALNCGACGIKYSSHDGIWDFRCRRHDYYFNPVPPAEMKELISQAPKVAWDDTVRGFLRFVKNVPEWVDNVAVNGRYAWKLFLDLRPGSKFLDFGCGLGNLSQNVAPHVGEVVALDLTWERLQFARQRFARFSTDERVTLVAGGDGAHLPFPDGYFDCIALSGVLEWIADDSAVYESAGSRAARALKMMMSFFGETNPRKTQIRFLRELRRILKSDGQIFVAIENRWNYEYFVGHPDHHSGLMYASLLPRFIANLYSIVYGHRPYRTYTHSFAGFRRLFSRAGLPAQEFYGLAPGYTGLREVIPAYTDQRFWKPLRPVGMKDRVKRSRYFVPAFGIALRPAASASQPLIARVLQEAAKSLSAGGIAVSECIITGKDKVVCKVFAGNERFILKMPADHRARTGEANNWRMLDVLSRRSATVGIVPQRIAHGEYQAVEYFLERAVAGQPMTMAMHAITRASAASKVAALLTKIHAPVPLLASIEEGSQPYGELLGLPVAKLRELGLEPSGYEKLECHLAGTLATRQWPIGLYHGDFTNDNIFISRDEISGVIDWEYASERGIPLLDALSYVESMERLCGSGMNATQNFIRLAAWDWPSEAEIDSLQSLYRHFRVDVECHKTLCQLCWLQHVSNQLDTTARFDPGFMEKHIRPMLATLSAS